MITVKKKCECTVTLDGVSVEVLRDICALARKWENEHRGIAYPGGRDEIHNMRAFIDEIQSKTEGVE